MTSTLSHAGSRPVGIAGTITTRLLVNQLVDPDEAAHHLPDGLRPRIGPDGATIVGCCLITVRHLRPRPVPGRIGLTVRAVAHRISCLTGRRHQPTPALYVPVRHTDSRPTLLAGGRVYPGVHRRADIATTRPAGQLCWTVHEPDDPTDFIIRATARTDRTRAPDPTLVDTVIGTTLGISPRRRPDRYDHVHMRPAQRTATAIELTHLDSPYLGRFTTATPTHTLLMTDTPVTWTTAGRG